MAEHANEHDHVGGHVVDVKYLAGTFGALMFLTAATVLATKVNFGYSFNLALAMLIAVAKATLVVLFFMHLFWDKLFHSVLFVSGLLAATLFVGITVMDSGQYQQELEWQLGAKPEAPYGPGRVQTGP